MQGSVDFKAFHVHYFDLPNFVKWVGRMHL